MTALRAALSALSDSVYFDLLESDDAYLLLIDVPGVSAETVEYTVEDGHLSIDARRAKDHPSDFEYLEENRTLFLDVDVPIPADASGTDVTLTVDRGVLEIELPKRSVGDEMTIDVVDGEPVSSDVDERTGDDGSDPTATDTDPTDTERETPADGPNRDEE